MEKILGIEKFLLDGEEIEAIYININEFENYLKDKFYSPLLSFAHLWFLKRTN